MQQMKQGVSKATPCILLDSTDFKSPEPGIAYGSVTCSYRKEGATSWSTKALSGKWTEVGGGVYLITWDTADLDTVGRFDYMCVSSGCLTYYGSLQVMANLNDDVAGLVTIVDGVVDGIASTVGGLNDLSAAEVLAAVTTDSVKWSGALIANLDATVGSRSSHAPADVVALMNDLSAVEVLAALTTDSVKFAGGNIANLDATVGSRSSHSAADVVALMNDLSSAEVLAALTTDSVKWSGTLIANLNATVGSRSSHAPADVVALMNDLSAAEVLAALTTDGVKFAGANIANLDKAVSAAESAIRGADSDTLKSLSDQIDGISGSTLTAAEVADAVLDELLADHLDAGSLSAVVQAIYDKLMGAGGACGFE